MDGQEILSGTVSYNGTTERNLANAIVSAINDCTSSIQGNCQVAGYSASRSGGGSTRYVDISAPLSLGNFTATPVITRTSGGGTVAVTGAFSALRIRNRDSSC